MGCGASESRNLWIVRTTPDGRALDYELDKKNKERIRIPIFTCMPHCHVRTEVSIIMNDANLNLNKTKHGGKHSLAAAGTGSKRYSDPTDYSSKKLVQK